MNPLSPVAASQNPLGIGVLLRGGGSAMVRPIARFADLNWVSGVAIL